MPENIDKKFGSPGSFKSKETPENKKDISALSSSVSDSVDVLEGIDAMGNVSEKVSENISENSSSTTVNSSNASSVSGYSGTTQDLINSKPSKAEMAKEIKATIEHEMKKLRKEAMTLVKSSKNGNAYKLNLLIAKLRNLKSILNGMFKMSYDRLKTLWLKIVHNIK